MWLYHELIIYVLCETLLFFIQKFIIEKNGNGFACTLLLRQNAAYKHHASFSTIHAYTQINIVISFACKGNRQSKKQLESKANIITICLHYLRILIVVVSKLFFLIIVRSIATVPIMITESYYHHKSIINFMGTFFFFHTSNTNIMKHSKY